MRSERVVGAAAGVLRGFQVKCPDSRLCITEPLRQTATSYGAPSFLPAETPPPDLARCDLCARRSFNLFHPLSSPAISILARRRLHLVAWADGVLLKRQMSRDGGDLTESAMLLVRALKGLITLSTCRPKYSVQILRSPGIRSRALGQTLRRVHLDEMVSVNPSLNEKPEHLCLDIPASMFGEG